MWTATPMDLPKCQKCSDGTMIPLSDYGQGGSAVVFKAWVCARTRSVGFRSASTRVKFTYGKRIERKR